MITVWHYLLAGALILLAGMDFVTTEHAFASFPCKEANPSPIMQWLAGHPKRHFIIKSGVIGCAVGWFLSYPESSWNAAISMAVLFICTLLFGIAQMSNIYQIFIKVDPC